MPVLLGEDQGGRVGPGDTVGFPNLKLCQAVVCEMKDGSLVGAHFTGNHDRGLLDNLRNDLDFHRGDIRSVTIAYDSRHMEARNNRNEVDVVGKAKLLRTSNIQFLDLANIRVDETEATFLQISVEDGEFNLSALDHRSMKYTTLTGRDENYQQQKAQMTGQGLGFINATGEPTEGLNLTDVTDQLENVEVKLKRTIKDVLEEGRDKAKSIGESALEVGNAAKESVKSKVGLK